MTLNKELHRIYYRQKYICLKKVGKNWRKTPKKRTYDRQSPLFCRLIDALLCRASYFFSINATACALIPSSRPVKPNLSSVVAFMLTASSETFKRNATFDLIFSI